MPFVNELIKNTILNELVLVKQVREQDYPLLNSLKLFNLTKQHLLRREIHKLTTSSVATFAAYPSIEKPVILCQLDCIQSIAYAEKFLLPKSTGLNHIIKSFIGALAGISYEFDSFVIIESSLLTSSLKIKKVEQLISLNPSFIELCTSNPTLLIFDEEQIKSPIVLRKLSLGRQKQVELCNQLCQLNINFFPQPLLVEKTESHLICIEELISGYPWFQLKDSLEPKDVKNKAVVALKNFEATVKKIPEWNESINLYDTGIQLYSEILPNIELSSVHKRSIKSELNSLKGHDNIQVPFQHGDFSINNLIYTNGPCKIIDLEDFGELTLPLFDYISLAISFTDSYLSDLTAENVFTELNLILKESETEYPEYFRRFSLILFLLSRLGQWSDNPNRKPFSKKLELLLVDVLNK